MKSPEHATVSLVDVTEPRVDQTGPKGAEFTYVDIGSIDRDTKRITDPKVLATAKAPSRAKQVLKSGDVLVSMTRPNLNAVALVPPDLDGAVGSTGFHVLRARGTEPKYLYYAVQARSFVEAMSLKVQGALYPAVRPRDIAAFEIPAISRAAQRHVVEDVETQLTRLESGADALRRVQANLRRYCAAVLKAACEGRLVATEATWKHVPLKHIIGPIGQGWSPRCDLSREASPEEWAVITTTAVQPMRYIDNQGKLLPAALMPRPHLEVLPGDFLMTRKGPRKRAGVACLVRVTRPRLMVCDTVYRFRCDESKVIPGYLELALNSPSVVEAIDRQKSGINESGVSLTHDKLGGILIPLPPLTEQELILAEVEQRLSTIDGIASVVSVNLQRSRRLRQSVLQAAFVPMKESALPLPPAPGVIA